MTETTPTIIPGPVRKTVAVAAPPETAFEAFVNRMGRWWPASHSVNASPMVDIVIEPFARGRWYERGADGSIASWGAVLVWAPPHKLVLIWRLDADWTYQPTLATEVEVRFTAEGSGTRVDLEHRRLELYGERVAAARGALDSDRGWGSLLGLFASATPA
jgi:uncharacterized protein YndB with AHSA1/START domain